MPGGSTLQRGNEIFDQMVYTPAVTFPTLATNASSTTAVTIPNASVGDLVSWNMQAPPAHLTIDNVYISAANTAQVQWGTDATGITGATVAVLWSFCRGENVSLNGVASLPNGIY
jgi:hypothetical protein